MPAYVILLLAAAGILWVAAFAGFAVAFGPMLVSADGPIAPATRQRAA
jgi:uncharacterized protein involved in response to NO